MATLRCKEPFSADIKGVPRVVPAGQLVDSSDPIVKGREHLFESVDAHMASRDAAPDTRAAVETATSAPGEKRSVTRRKAD
jgi:hypothetical protein